MTAAQRIWLICSIAILATVIGSRAAESQDRALLIGINADEKLRLGLQHRAAEIDARLMQRVARQVGLRLNPQPDSERWRVRALLAAQPDAALHSATGLVYGRAGQQVWTAVDVLEWSGGSEPPPDARAAQMAGDLLPVQSSHGLKLELIGGGQVGGAPLKVRVTSPKDGYLIVVDRRADGSAVQLFPSKCVRPSRRIRAGAPLTLPDPSYGCRFVPDSAGRGEIIAIVTEDNVALDGLLGRHRDLVVVPDGDAYLAQITGKLMQVWTDDSRNRPVKWGMAIADYVVER
jgi:hypothetical protein